MSMDNIGLLHPGEMGISLAASAINSSMKVHWVSKDRSVETKNRAEKYSLSECDSLEQLCDISSVIISVCPPHAAEALAENVKKCHFSGIYADVNAISPEKSQRIGQQLSNAGIDYVDGGVVGGPAWSPNTTWLYLSGGSAEKVAKCFSDGPLETELVGAEVGKASAIKMCFAAYTKGTTALLCSIMATAEGLGVRQELEQQWSREGSDFAERAQNRIRRVTAKAWRFAGEMEEIAETMGSQGLPTGFHLAANDIYQRISRYKGASPIPTVNEVLITLLKP